MQEVKASVKEYILRVTFGGDGQDISSAGNLGIRKLSPEWASFFQNLLKSSPTRLMGEDKGKNDGENHEKGFSPSKTAKSSPTSQMGEDSSVSSQKKPGKRRSHDLPNSQKRYENPLDEFINFTNTQMRGNAGKDEMAEICLNMVMAVPLKLQVQIVVNDILL
jgi:hypothetical protein